MPSQDELNTYFQYEPDTGRLFRRIRFRAGKPVGSEVGYSFARGYLATRGFGNKAHLFVHRIIWTMLHGDIPAGMQIDHVDHNRQNNKLSNLRLVTRAENMKNFKRSKANKSGHTGVLFRASRNKWRAFISGKEIGTFKTREEAISARASAEVALGYHPNHGDN